MNDVSVKPRRLGLPAIILVYIVFLAIWFVRELWLRPIFSASLGAWGFEVCETATKLLVWTAPAVFGIKYFKGDMAITLREMLTGKVKWLKYLLILLGFAAYNVIGAILINGKLSISENFSLPPLISVVLFVGVTEEAVFRGFFLNALLKKVKTWYAVLITALLFLIIHFPIWIHEGVFVDSVLSGGFVIIMALSVIFSWAFIKSRNIFVPVILHMSWNLLVTLFFG